jgi:putative transferase (TIGR04331 family)
MNETARYLITSSNEKTWKFDRPVIFLGEWCKVYGRMSIWKDMDYIVAKSYGLEEKQKINDLRFVRSLEEKLFNKFYELLNQVHNRDEDERYWKIVLGHWFRRTIDVLFNRIKTIEHCLLKYNISGTMLLSFKDLELASVDSSTSILAFNDESWNCAVNDYIIKYFGKNFPVEYINLIDENNFNIRREKILKKISFKSHLLKFLRYFYTIVSNNFISNNEAFIVNSYLPKIEELKLQFALGQFPKLWKVPKFTSTKKVDLSLRERLTKQFTITKSDGVESIVTNLLFKLIPICYLESFTELENFSSIQKWPNSPKFIFTSNCYDFDEVFKIWSANKLKSGSKYYIGQHGNNYGTNQFYAPSIEEIYSDKFLSWGWVDSYSKILPAFIITQPKIIKKNFCSNGKLLLVELCLNHRITTWDVFEEFQHYFNDQLDFVSNLSQHPRDDLIVRLHSGYQNFNWGELLRWNDFDPNVIIDEGKIKLAKLTCNARLIVFSYDSTGFLEALSQNTPTLAFWQNDFDHLKDSAKPYYKLLLEAGIIHLDSDKAAKKVNDIWEDVEGWWSQSSVQEARRIFCDRYAKVSRNPVKDLIEIFQH